MRGRHGSVLISEVEEQLLGAQLAGSVDVIVASLQLGELVVRRRAWYARSSKY